MTEPLSATLHKILDAASAVFAEHGFAGARVDEIARRAGVNKAMLYYHVGNKQALYTVVLTRNFDRMEEALRGALATTGSARDRLRSIIGGVAGVLRELPDHSRIVLREFASGGSNLEPEVLARMAKVLATVRGLLGQGVRSGEFRPIDPVMTHLTLVGASLILHAVLPLRQRVSEIDPGIGVPDDQADIGSHLADLLLHGIATTGNGEDR